MKFCPKCKGSGKILEKRLSEYVNSYDYYPVPCPHSQQEATAVNSRKSYSLSR
ncbi:hypothetical protein [Geminocystis herdmanii]|uniref:hypothetical protein n=1 Tax=Geminocystis herdmanii TaxID=669359 RepID=UPI000349C55D|nr:hypothetical protein [Geminocystis herdmanii]